MRIGILTQPLINNYGGILQNYALQKVLKDLGEEPVTLNFVHRPIRWSLIRLCCSVVKRLSRRLFGRNQKYLNPIKEERDVFTVQPSQKKFIADYISKKDLTSALTSVQEEIKDFDAFIVGSDQIWRPLYSPNINNFFLDFANKDQRKIAYAASFGTKQWEFPAELTALASTCLQRFDGISVREDSGVRLCKDYLSCDAVQVLDPTLLLKQSDYVSLTLGFEKVRFKKYIAIYILDKNKLKNKMIDRLASFNGTKVCELGTSQTGELQSIEAWLSGIQYADMVITDSFHGTVFSIIFHKPFVAFFNPERGNARFESLLKPLGLENRLVALDSDSPSPMAEIDWENVDEKLSQMRKFSLDFLKNALYGER